MKNYTENFAKNFKQTYTAKMGGSQTIQLPNGQQFEFNDKQYYNGRGGKYNSSIRHDNKGLIKISRKEFSAILKSERERNIRIKEMIADRKSAAKRYADNAAAGVYGLKVTEHYMYVELSEFEQESKQYDCAKLAKTLHIFIEDARLLKSNGKTYVFAKKIDGSGTLELFHPSLSCNNLNISVSEISKERIAEFNQSEWASAPYAAMLGQTNNANHFVC